MIRLLKGLMILSVVATIAGCGGVSENDMRKYAIRRPKDDEDETPKKPNVATPSPAANQANTNPQAGSGAAPVAAAPAPGSAAPGTPNTVIPGGTATASPPPGSVGGGVNADVDLSVSDTKRPDANLSISQRRQMTIDNMQRITRAIEAYREANGSYPPRAIFSKGGQPMLSWRVLLLPTLGYQELYDKFKLNEPWDSVNNQPLVKLIPSVFQSPDRFDTSTNYLVPVGNTCAFSGTRGNHPRRWEDGIANIAILFEVDDAFSVPWSAPNDLEVDLRQPKQGLGGLRSDGFFVGWGGGRVGRIDAAISPRDAKAMLTVDGGESFSAAGISRAPNATPLASGGPERRGPVAVAANTPTSDARSDLGYASSPSALRNPAFTAYEASPRAGSSGESLLAKAVIARDAELNNDAYRLVLAAYVTDEPGTQVNFQWFPTLRRPALAVRFGAGVTYSGTQATSIRTQLAGATGKGRDAKSRIDSVVGDLADPIFARLMQFNPIQPPLLSQANPRRSNRRNINSGPHVEVIGEGSRNTLIRAARQLHVDVLLYFDVNERSTRNNKKSKSVAFSVIDVWRGKDLLPPLEINYLKRQLAKENSNALYEDPVDEIAEKFRRLLTDKLQPEPIPVALRETHAKKRVVSLARRPVTDPLSVLAEVKLYRDLDLLSVQDQMTAYQMILDDETAGTELLAGEPEEKQNAIREWIPIISPEDTMRVQRGYDDDDDD